MNILHLALATFVMAVLASASTAQDSKKLLVGKWQAVKVDEGTLPMGAVVEFSADGKLKVTMKKGDKDDTVEGTYTVEAQSFTYKMTVMGMEHSQKITIKKISETELDTANPDGKAVLFKRAK
jgi:uncharacterized protein (TIGR03066 family)